jgi:membrane protein
MIAVGMSVFFINTLGYCGYYCCFEVFIHKLTGNQVLNEQIPLIVMGRYGFNFNDFNHNLDTFKFGTKHDKTRAFISIGSVFTTVWAIIISYFWNLGYPILSVQSTLWFYWDFINYDVLYLD